MNTLLPLRSLAVKLTLAFLLVSITGAALMAVLLQVRARTAFDQFIVRRGQETLVANLEQYYQVNGSWSGLNENLPFMVYSPPPPGEQGGIEIRRGFPFTLASPDHIILVSDEPGLVGKQVSRRDLSRAVPLKTANGNLAGWLFLFPINRDWTPNSPEAMFLNNINRATLVSAGVAAVLALTLGGLLAFTMTRSLREMTEATVEIAKGHLGQQVPVRSRDELGELAESFNKMSLDLAQATQARRQMTADIAHDLRSPLSVISGYAEALSDGKLAGDPEIYTILHQETQQLSRLIDDLRTLSLADAGELPLNLQPCDPFALLERVAARHALSAKQKGVVIKVEPGQKSQVRVDPERMVQVLDNLIVNAFRFTPAGGEIILSSTIEAGSVLISVCDNGSGIDPAELPHIFDRFYRGDKSRHGNGESGLGLAIAKAMVEAQGGSITAASQPGQGATFMTKLKEA